MAAPKKPDPVVLPWLNEGKETKLGTIPVKGDQRLEMMRVEGAEIVAQDYKSFMCHFRGSLLAAKDALKEQGVADVHKQWMILFGEYENLRWDQDSFDKSLDVAIQDYVFQVLKVDNREDALKAIEAEARTLNKNNTAAFARRRREWQQEMRLEEAYWMLWRAEPHPAFMPDPTKVPTEAQIEAAKAHIANFLDDDAYGVLAKAQRGISTMTANLEALKSPMTEEMVRKKAQTTSKP